MRIKIAFLVFFAPFMALGQHSIFSGLVETVPNSTIEIILQKTENFVLEQRKRKESAKSEIRFLNSLVKDSHREFLKSYKPYSQFNELFETGQYDCLSGTSFFSLVLSELGFQYKIIETNYHIFLMIETNQGQILLETTDHLFGLKTNTKEMASCLEKYRRNELTASSSNRSYYLYRTKLFQQVSPHQLPGLLYFNQAVVAFNHHDLITCVNRLDKARIIYNNARVEELTDIVIKSITTSLLDEMTKSKLLIKLTQYQKQTVVFAGR